MKTIKSVRAFLGIGVLLLGVGCGSHLVKKMQKLADQACACKDRACAEKVNAKFTAFQKEHMKDTIPKSDKEKLMKASLRLGQCLANKLGRVPGIQGAKAGSGGQATAAGFRSLVGSKSLGGSGGKSASGGSGGKSASGGSGGKSASGGSGGAGGKAAGGAGGKAAGGAGAKAAGGAGAKAAGGAGTAK